MKLGLSLQDAASDRVEVLKNRLKMACRNDSSMSTDFTSDTHADDRESNSSKDETTIKKNLQKYLHYCVENLTWRDLIHFKHFKIGDKRRYTDSSKNEDRTEAMLKQILNMTVSGRFCDFVEHLKYLGCSKLVSILTGKMVPTNQEQRQRIGQLMPELCNSVKVMEILPELVAKQAIGHEDKNAIYNTHCVRGNWEATHELLLILPNKHPNWFKILVGALNSSNNQELVQELERSAIRCDGVQDDARSVCTIGSDESDNSSLRDGLQYNNTSTMEITNEAIWEKLNDMAKDITSMKVEQRQTSVLVQRMYEQKHDDKRRQVPESTKRRDTHKTPCKNASESTKRRDTHKTPCKNASGSKRRGEHPTKFPIRRLASKRQLFKKPPLSKIEEYSAVYKEDRPNLETFADNSELPKTLQILEENEDETFRCLSRFNNPEKELSIEKKIYVGKWVRQHSRCEHDITHDDGVTEVARYNTSTRSNGEDESVLKQKPILELMSLQERHNQSVKRGTRCTIPSNFSQDRATDATANAQKVDKTIGNKKYQEGDLNMGGALKNKQENAIKNITNLKTASCDQCSDNRNGTSNKTITLPESDSLILRSGNVNASYHQPLSFSARANGNRRAEKGETEVVTDNKKCIDNGVSCYNEDKDGHLAKETDILDKSKIGQEEKYLDGSKIAFSSRDKDNYIWYAQSNIVCDVSEKSATQKAAGKADEFDSINKGNQSQKLRDSKIDSVDLDDIQTTGLQDSNADIYADNLGYETITWSYGSCNIF